MRKFREKGFSLIEFLIVIAVIAILVGIAAPNYLRWRATTLTAEAAQQFARDVDRLRTEVKRENAGAAVVVTSGQRSYEVDGRTVALPGGVEVYRVTDDGTVVAKTTMTFHPPHATLDAVRRRTFELRWIANPDIQRTVIVVGVTGKAIIQ